MRLTVLNAAVALKKKFSNKFFAWNFFVTKKIFQLQLAQNFFIAQSNFQYCGERFF